MIILCCCSDVLYSGALCTIVYSSCGFQQGDNIGITSSTCRHCTLSTSIMCCDSYPIPLLSLFSLYPLLLIQRIFYVLVSFFLLHACMHTRCSHQVYNCNGPSSHTLDYRECSGVISLQLHFSVVHVCIYTFANNSEISLLALIQNAWKSQTTPCGGQKACSLCGIIGVLDIIHFCVEIYSLPKYISYD